jgi:hypothetical protein
LVAFSAAIARSSGDMSLSLTILNGETVFIRRAQTLLSSEQRRSTDCKRARQDITKCHHSREVLSAFIVTLICFVHVAFCFCSLLGVDETLY